MDKKDIITILQIGSHSWEGMADLPEHVNWYFLDTNDLPAFVESSEVMTTWFLTDEEIKKKESLQFTALVLTDKDYGPDLLELDAIIPPYAVFYNCNDRPSSSSTQLFLNQKCYQAISLENPTETMAFLSKVLFTGQYGVKFHINDFAIAEDLQQKSYFKGHYYLAIEASYGLHFRPIGSMRYNHPFKADRILTIWWELMSDESVDMMINVQLIQSGTTDSILKEWIIEGEDLEKPFDLDYPEAGYVSITLLARGYGAMKVGPLHFRHGRAGLGEFILGGKRYADASGQEFMYYFEPGDLKPPLNVYFSGYRSTEGFEGYFMMKKMGAPFLLICDPRLEGGAFYIGSPSFEQAIPRVINESLKQLGFSNKELILSGLSMGTYGALYYASYLLPHAIIVGKPLINLGTMAANLQLKRPDEFATSLDLLQLIEGDLSDNSIKALNQHFWNAFERADLSQTLLAVAYMKNDDYDIEAYHDLIAYASDKKPKIIGKGWIGRHNDNSGAIIKWFLAQYDSIMKKDFQRE